VLTEGIPGWVRLFTTAGEEQTAWENVSNPRLWHAPVFVIFIGMFVEIKGFSHGIGLGEQSFPLEVVYPAKTPYCRHGPAKLGVPGTPPLSLKGEQSLPTLVGMAVPSSIPMIFIKASPSRASG
jgi:hypothetical protein